MKRAGESVGAARIRLLEEIERHGSISAAAKAVGLSYKGAWDAVQALNNLSRQPLVLATAGGRAGGAASVSPAGRALIAAFGRAETALSAYAAEVQAVLDGEGVDFGDFLRSITMKTSARNAYHGTVTTVIDGAVNAEVTLKVSDSIDLVAIITRESVAAMDLKPGAAVVALIKSSFVLLASGHERLGISARNRLLGTVSAITTGAVNDEVTLAFDAGKTLIAIITHGACVEMGLEVGQPAQALIKASHIILASG
ncbi:TOBE domain-containing protein [Asticcacaulis solisilvae]|uniref:TOBE domain-containing protein n=1 Tax=Asticcacaulis solisilvae TaxID=1217274 RepID=UPI003FD87184